MQEDQSRKRQTPRETAGAPAPSNEASKARKLKATKLLLGLDRYRDKMATTIARINDVIEDIPGDISSDFPHICSDSDTEMGAIGGNPKRGKPLESPQQEQEHAAPSAVDLYMNIVNSPEQDPMYEEDEWSTFFSIPKGDAIFGRMSSRTGSLSTRTFGSPTGRMHSRRGCRRCSGMATLSHRHQCVSSGLP
jgi:hypothetical protein